MNTGITRIKNVIRVAEAVLQPRIRTAPYRQTNCRWVRSHWWDNTRVDDISRELDGYFDTIERHGWCPRCILDVGAETGLFSIVAGQKFKPQALWVIEPSLRNRILLKRNLRLNHLSVRGMGRHALWNHPCELSFRSHGAISSIQGVGGLATTLPFVERVQAMTLDETLRGWNEPGVDLIKMDIEGAEIEALEGGQNTLGEGGIRPNLLIQAYHLRNGSRTLERCAERLQGLGYCCAEDIPGLLAGWPR